MNEALNTNRLLKLSSNSSYLKYHNKPILLSSSTLFEKAPELLFLVALNRNRFMDLYIDNYNNSYLDRKIDGMDKSIRYFNIIINVFNVIFNKSLQIPNGLRRLCALSLRKLRGEGILVEVGWIVNSWAFTLALPTSKGLKWIAIVESFIRDRDIPAKALEKTIG